MHILIVGGTGLIGTQLSSYLSKLGHNVTILTRNLHKPNHCLKTINFIRELGNTAKPYQVIINLAGEPLNSNRWNSNVKKNIYESRIKITQKIIDYIKIAEVKPQVLISGSAVGFYGSSLDETFTEESEPAENNFTQKLCYDWEKIAEQASQYKVRVCFIRTGIVLAKEGGALKEMLIPFKLGLGAQLGHGSQWMSWIHMKDVVESIEYLINHPNLKGPFNLTAPIPVTNKSFTKALAENLKRKSIFILPNFVVKIMFGEMGEYLLLKGQKVIPDRLIKLGYSFKFSRLEDALKDILA